MGFRQRRALRDTRKGSLQPEVTINLIPMLDVLMTVLTFFIIVSMTLALDRGVNTNIAKRSGNAVQPDTLPLIVKLSPGGVRVNEQPVSRSQLLPLVKGYLANSSEGIAMLQADPNVSYEQTVELLGELKLIGGDRVLLAIE